MGCAPQGQRTLKCYYQRTSGEPLYEQGRIRGFSRRFGDCSGSTVFAALPDRRLVLTPEIRAFLGFLPDSVKLFSINEKVCAGPGSKVTLYATWPLGRRFAQIFPRMFRIRTTRTGLSLCGLASPSL